MRPTPWSSAASRPTTRASQHRKPATSRRTAREYRATVEAAYTWDAAALELRQVWEAHETKWPSPEDAHGDGDRHLSPEANAEVERGCGRDPRDRRERHYPCDARHRIRRPGPPPDRPRTPPQGNRTPEGKGGGSARSAAQGRQPRQALARFRTRSDSRSATAKSSYTGGVTADLERLTASGCELAKPLKNWWESDQYKGINTPMA